MKLPMIVLAAGVAVLSTIAVASETDHRSAYAGQETRPIKSLSADCAAAAAGDWPRQPSSTGCRDLPTSSK